MKMVNIIFWACLIIFLGVMIIVNAFTKIDIPIFRIILGIIIIYGGLNLLFGPKLWGSKQKGSAVFSEEKFDYEEGQTEYNAVFGSNTVDLRGIKLEGNNKKIEVNAVFSSSRVMLDSDTPFLVQASAVFGGINLPDGQNTSFSTQSFQSADFDPDQPHLLIKANAVFGSIIIRYKD